MSYLTRALKARDPRFRRIFGKLGYDTKPMAAEESPAETVPLAMAPVASVEDDLAILRAEYAAVVGKRPFMGWEAAMLREKIAAAKAGT
ncbi:MAG: hypothetical protein ACK4NE_00040 [Albidovulum sp.]